LVVLIVRMIEGLSCIIWKAIMAREL